MSELTISKFFRPLNSTTQARTDQKLMVTLVRLGVIDQVTRRIPILCNVEEPGTDVYFMIRIISNSRNLRGRDDDRAWVTDGKAIAKCDRDTKTTLMPSSTIGNYELPSVGWVNQVIGEYMAGVVK